MLSGETAAGTYPVEAVQTMHKIASRAESSLDYRNILSLRSKESKTTITDAISQSVSFTALNLEANAVITATEKGQTARSISKYRPKAPIIAVTSNEDVCRKLSLVWGVTPVKGEKAETTDEMFQTAIDSALKAGFVQHGNLVVNTAGVPVGESGSTNLMKVHVIGDVLAKGQGIGQTTARGKVVVARTAKEALDNMEPGAILVTMGTDRDMIPAFEKAGAVITEEGGLTSHAAVVGVSLGIPVIVGLQNAMTMFKNGQEITVDASKGYIYDGHQHVL
jgi:pyruvate kinase